jgi:hypothetical protein
MKPEKVDRVTRKQSKKTDPNQTKDNSQLITCNITEDPMTVELVLSSHDVTEPYRYQNSQTSSDQVLPTTDTIVNYYSVIRPQDGSAVQTEPSSLLTSTSSEVNKNSLCVLHMICKNRYRSCLHHIFNL